MCATTASGRRAGRPVRRRRRTRRCMHAAPHGCAAALVLQPWRQAPTAVASNPPRNACAACLLAAACAAPVRHVPLTPWPPAPGLQASPAWSSATAGRRGCTASPHMSGARRRLSRPGGETSLPGTLPACRCIGEPLRLAGLVPATAAHPLHTACEPRCPALPPLDAAGSWRSCTRWCSTAQCLTTS